MHRQHQYLRLFIYMWCSARFLSMCFAAFPAVLHIFPHSCPLLDSLHSRWVIFRSFISLLTKDIPHIVCSCFWVISDVFFLLYDFLDFLSVRRWCAAYFRGRHFLVAFVSGIFPAPSAALVGSTLVMLVIGLFSYVYLFVVRRFPFRQIRIVCYIFYSAIFLLYFGTLDNCHLVFRLSFLLPCVASFSYRRVCCS